MKLVSYNVFSNEFRAMGIEYAVNHCLDLGFEAVEFITNYKEKVRLFNDHVAAKSAKRYLDSKGLSVACYSMLADLTDPNPAFSVEPLLRNIEHAAALEAPCFHHTLIPFYDPSLFSSYDAALSAVLENAERIAEKCEKYGIFCIYEPQGLYMNGVEGLGKFLNEMKKRHKNVGICGDMANSYFVDVLPEDVFEAFSKDIKHIHAKDYLIKDPDGSDWKQRSISGKYIYDMPIGEGEIDFAKIFNCVKGYQGGVSIEFSGSEEQLKKSIENIKKFMYYK